jgi:drug/metabolite transporter (DMT)-like permease
VTEVGSGVNRPLGAASFGVAAGAAVVVVVVAARRVRATGDTEEPAAPSRWLAVGWVMLLAGLTALVAFVLLPGWSGD